MDSNTSQENFEKLIAACEAGNLDSVKKHAVHKNSINNKTTQGWTPLVVACYNENLHIVQWLIDNGADVNACNSKGTTVFMYAKTPVFISKQTTILHLLLAKGVNINAVDKKEGKTVLDYVVTQNAQWLVKWMQERGAKFAHELG